MPKRQGKPPKRSKSVQAIADEIGHPHATTQSWLKRKIDPMPEDGPERAAWLARNNKDTGGGQATRLPSAYGRSSNERLLEEAE